MIYYFIIVDLMILHEMIYQTVYYIMFGKYVYNIMWCYMIYDDIKHNKIEQHNNRTQSVELYMYVYYVRTRSYLFFVCICFYLFIYSFIHLFICLFLSFFLYLFLYFFIYLLIYFFIYISLFIYLFIYLFLDLYIGTIWNILRKPAGRLGEVSPCERSEN